MTGGVPGSPDAGTGQGAGVDDTRALTFVVVVFEAELELLRLQARSMDDHLAPDDVHEVIVIDNTVSGLSARRRRGLLRQFGRLRSRTRVVTPRDLGLTPSMTGWTGQQILKLVVAAEVTTRWYVVLDAKNHFIAPTTRSTFVGDDGRAHLGRHSFEAHPLRAGVERTMRFAGIDPERHLGHFPVTRTPFVMSTRDVRDLTDWLGTQDGDTVPETFVRHGLVEFPLYSSWMIASGRLAQTYDEEAIPCPTVWPGRRSRRDVDAVLTAASQPGIRVLAVHRTALARMSLRSAADVVSFWRAHAVVGSTLGGWVFLGRFRLSYSTSMALRSARRALHRS